VAFREKPTTIQTVITDHEFENPLGRTSAVFSARQSRLLKFPSRVGSKRLNSFRTR
jgi:hypothetical protein